MRTIEKINVLKNKYGTTVYVNFSDETYGTRTFENGKWTTSGLTSDELETAKKLAVVNGKWQNYKAPRKTAAIRSTQNNDEDVVSDINEYRKFVAQHPGIGSKYSDQTEENLANSGL